MDTWLEAKIDERERLYNLIMDKLTTSERNIIQSHCDRIAQKAIKTYLHNHKDIKNVDI